jgi:hypothetical protein
MRGRLSDPTSTIARSTESLTLDKGGRHKLKPHARELRMAALRKDENRISPVQKVGRDEFARFVETVRNPPAPSAALRASVATGHRKG